MNKIHIPNFPLIKNFYKLNIQRQSITLSNSPTIKRIKHLKKSLYENNESPQNLTTYNTIKNFNAKFSSTIKNDSKTINAKTNRDNFNLYMGLGNEKIRMKKMFNDLISWNNKNNVTDRHRQNINFDLKKFKIPRIKSNKIINPELIPVIKFSENVKKEPIDSLKLLKLKFSVFDKDFDNDKFNEEQKKLKDKLRYEEIEKSAKIVESTIDKRIQKTKLQNEIKNRESLIIIHKRLTLNKLKKKKFIELLNETYQLLEKARVEYQLSVDILNERMKYIKNYYAVFINLFKGFPIKLLEDEIKHQNKNQIGNTKKEKEKDSEENEEITSQNENQLNLKSESNVSPKISKTKSKIRYEEKMRMYVEYISIHDDIIKEIQNYEKKYDNIQGELNNIISNIKMKIEEINNDSNKMRLIQQRLSQNQIKYYLNKLKKGIDIRYEGLSWIVTRLIELNVQIDSSLFPDFLDQEQIKYIILISKYGYEINQLKIILDCLREKETGKANANLKIFGTMTEEGLLSSFFFNKNEDNKSDYIFSNNSKTEKTLLKLMKSNPLLSHDSNIIAEEHKKLQIENNLIDLKSKQLKRRLSMAAIDKTMSLTNKKLTNNEKIDKLVLLSTDKKSKFFYDILKVIEKINNLINLINEKREEEMILFNEKYKIKDLNDEVAKSYYNKAFNALFGNTTFQYTEK